MYWKQNHKVTLYGKAGSQEAGAKIHNRSMLTSIGASTVSGATLRYVTTSYCGSCIKVLRKDWGKGTKKVKPFAYTPESETGLIKLSGWTHLPLGWLQPGRDHFPPNRQHQVWAGHYRKRKTEPTLPHTIPNHWQAVCFHRKCKVSDLCHQHPLERCFPQGKCFLWHVTGEFLVMFVLYTAITSSSSRETKYPT